jgi:hypothetical protein
VLSRTARRLQLRIWNLEFRIRVHEFQFPLLNSLQGSLTLSSCAQPEAAAVARLNTRTRTAGISLLIMEGNRWSKACARKHAPCKSSSYAASEVVVY